MFTCMATKTITITESSYNRLKSLKRGDESFSELIERITAAESDPLSGFGALADVEGYAESVEEARAELNRDFEKRTDDLFR